MLNSLFFLEVRNFIETLYKEISLYSLQKCYTFERNPGTAIRKVAMI